MMSATVKELRSFGLAFGLGMAIVTTLGLWHQWNPWIPACTGFLSVWHLCFALLYPKVLKPTRFVLHGLVTLVSNGLVAVVFTGVFFLLVTPFGFFARLFGRDAIRPFNSGSAWEAVSDADNSPAKIEKLF